MIVATAKPDDLPALLELEESGFDAPERWSTGSWASELSSPDRLVLISRDDDQVEAVACFGVLDDTAEVLRVVVRPDRRERGIANQPVRPEVDHFNLEPVPAGLERGREFRAPRRAPA